MNTSRKRGLTNFKGDFYHLIRSFHECEYKICSNVTFNDVNIKLKESDEAFLLEADLRGIDKKSIMVEYVNEDIVVNLKQEEEKENCGIGFSSMKNSVIELKRKFNIGDVNAECIESMYDRDETLIIYIPKN